MFTNLANELGPHIVGYLRLLKIEVKLLKGQWIINFPLSLPSLRICRIFIKESPEAMGTLW